jgi:hypothetical protein
MCFRVRRSHPKRPNVGPVHSPLNVFSCARPFYFAVFTQLPHTHAGPTLISVAEVIGMQLSYTFIIMCGRGFVGSTGGAAEERIRKNTGAQS